MTDHTGMNGNDMFGDTSPARFAELRDGGNIEAEDRAKGLIIVAIVISAALLVLAVGTVWVAFRLVWWLL